MNLQDIPLIDNEAENRVELHLEGHLAFIEYNKGRGRIALLHTEVPPQLEGRGVGSAIVEKTFQMAEANGLRVQPVCSFVQVYLKRHPQWERVVSRRDGDA